ncbi:hypothetical protein AMS68_001744 [Peltaster fructicola]|uniref:DNA mismatch repair proteins mutS family domain-containing protein n=1 Tax=Peltaster fructicola TaxID=286661 RepID=A0A6H0XN96_9PEZI|nr:hypothetical protein AMS68_001744 [Peltaster fructicola]
MQVRGAFRASQQVTKVIEYASIRYRLSPTGQTTWRRGAKRKTTLSVDDLPQGVLPPLPKLETQDSKDRSYSPVLQQHLNNVRKYKDCVVLTRVGDFYEMYFDQVDQFAGLVGLKKAKRSTNLGDVAMAGFQHTQLDRYLKMFVQDLGKQVAISEQVRLAEHERTNKPGAPLYDRKVTRVITPGTLVDESFVAPFENNFLLAIHFDDVAASKPPKLNARQPLQQHSVGLGWVDLSSGDFQVQTANVTALPTLLARINAREIVLSSALEGHRTEELQKILGDQTKSLSFHDYSNSKIKAVTDWAPMLEKEVQLTDNFTTQEIAAGNIILDYVVHRLFDANIKLQPPTRRSESEYMTIDKHSLRALEIKSTLRDGLQQGSLLHTIRRTVTNSGARLLGQRIVSPSMSLEVINNRLDLVQEMLEQSHIREDVTALLKDTSDTFRLLQRFSIGRGDADDMLGLARTIRLTQRMADILLIHMHDRQRSQRHTTEGGLSSELDCIKDVIYRLELDTPIKLAKEIESAIDEESLSQRQRLEVERAEQSEKLANEVAVADHAGEEAPKLARRMSKAANSAKNGQLEVEESWIMQRGASPALKAAHKELDDLFVRKQTLVAELRETSKMDSLTLRWTAQYGHHCHVKTKDTSKSLDAIKGARSFMSTKTTRSFYAPDWTYLGSKIDTAKSRIRAEEDNVFEKLKAHVLENLMKLRRNAAVLDELDVACSSAIVAKERDLVRPLVNESRTHNIVGGRHPTVDVGLLSQGKQFTANNCLVGSQELIYLITGPNMAGKSTYLRQNALITILAQTGCYVPAQYAEIGLVDKIFSRVGSADSLYQDQSTFMVEMLETAEILKQATARSFVIMDEVGRGTTPQDGVAVGDFERLGRYCTDVAEEPDGSWLYVHRLKPGVNRDSHALKVARLAGMPEAANEMAAKVLQKGIPGESMGGQQAASA